MVNWPKTIGLSEYDKLRIEAAHDMALRNRVVADPVSVLKERGIEVPSGLKVEVVQDTPEKYTVTLPPFVGSDVATNSLSAKSANNASWYCTTCTTTTPICIGSLASLTCIA